MRLEDYHESEGSVGYIALSQPGLQSKNLSEKFPIKEEKERWREERRDGHSETK